MKKLRSVLAVSALACASAALLRFPQETSDAVTDGLRLSASVLIPSLFPFFICVELMSALGVSGLLARALAPMMRQLFHVSGAGSAVILCGALGGYPSGAQAAAAMYRGGALSRTETEYLLLFCNNAGPAFLFGAVGAVLEIGTRGCLLLWAAQLLAALAVGLLHRPRTTPEASAPALPDMQAAPGALVDAIGAAGQSVLRITMTVAAFSVAARLLRRAAARVLPEGLCVIVSGLLELAGGIAGLAGLALSQRWKLTLASFFLGFGGLCVRTQTQAVLTPAGLSGRGMLGAKLVQGLLAALLTFCAAPLLPETAAVSAGGLIGAGAAGLLCCGAVCLGWRKMGVEISPEVGYNSRRSG